MFQVKLIIFFLIVSVAGGGYVYVQKLRADNATLKINTTKLQGAVEQNEATIKQQTENFEKLEIHWLMLEKKMQTCKQIKMFSLKSYQNMTLVNLPIARPGLVVKIVNKGR